MRLRRGLDAAAAHAHGDNRVRAFAEKAAGDYRNKPEFIEANAEQENMVLYAHEVRLGQQLNNASEEWALDISDQEVRFRADLANSTERISK